MEPETVKTEPTPMPANQPPPPPKRGRVLMVVVWAWQLLRASHSPTGNGNGNGSNGNGNGNGHGSTKLLYVMAGCIVGLVGVLAGAIQRDHDESMALQRQGIEVLQRIAERMDAESAMNNARVKKMTDEHDAVLNEIKRRNKAIVDQ